MAGSKIFKLTNSQLEQYNSLKNEIIEKGLSMENLEVFLEEIEERVSDLLSPIEKERKILEDRILIYKMILREMLGPQ